MTFRVWCLSSLLVYDSEILFTLDNVAYTCCFRILSSSHTSVSIFSVWCCSSVSISVVHLQAGEVMQAPCEAGEDGTRLQAQAVQQVEAGQAGAALHQALRPLLGYCQLLSPWTN